MHGVGSWTVRPRGGGLGSLPAHRRHRDDPVAVRSGLPLDRRALLVGVEEALAGPRRGRPRAGRTGRKAATGGLHARRDETGPRPLLQPDEQRLGVRRLPPARPGALGRSAGAGDRERHRGTGSRHADLQTRRPPDAVLLRAVVAGCVGLLQPRWRRSRIDPASQGREASYVNRAVAIFRHVAGLPTDQEPPAAP